MAFFRHMGKQRAQFFFEIRVHDAIEVNVGDENVDQRMFCVDIRRRSKTVRTRARSALQPNSNGTSSIIWDEVLLFPSTLYKQRSRPSFDSKMFLVQLLETENNQVIGRGRIDLAPFAQLDIADSLSSREESEGRALHEISIYARGPVIKDVNSPICKIVVSIQSRWVKDGPAFRQLQGGLAEAAPSEWALSSVSSYGHPATYSSSSAMLTKVASMHGIVSFALLLARRFHAAEGRWTSALKKLELRIDLCRIRVSRDLRPAIMMLSKVREKESEAIRMLNFTGDLGPTLNSYPIERIDRLTSVINLGNVLKQKSAETLESLREVEARVNHHEETLKESKLQKMLLDDGIAAAIAQAEASTSCVHKIRQTFALVTESICIHRRERERLIRSLAQSRRLKIENWCELHALSILRREREFVQVSSNGRRTRRVYLKVAPSSLHFLQRLIGDVGWKTVSLPSITQALHSSIGPIKDRSPIPKRPVLHGIWSGLDHGSRLLSIMITSQPIPWLLLPFPGLGYIMAASGSTRDFIDWTIAFLYVIEGCTVVPGGLRTQILLNKLEYLAFSMQTSPSDILHRLSQRLI